MPGHFECIGITDEESTLRSIDHAVSQGEARERRDGGSSFLWRDPSGASLSVHTSAAREIVCATPCFSTESTIDVRAQSLQEDPDCLFCSALHLEVVDSEGELIYPLAMQLEDADRLQSGFTSNLVRPARITGFAEEITAWPDEAAYKHAQEAAYEETEEREREPILAAESFIPVGLFAEPRKRRRFLKRPRTPSGGETATALLSGVVERTERRRNTLTNVDFAWARVRSYGGVTFDVVGPPDVSSKFAPGAIVQGLIWLVGSVELD